MQILPTAILQGLKTLGRQFPLGKSEEGGVVSTKEDIMDAVESKVSPAPNEVSIPLVVPPTGVYLSVVCYDPCISDSRGI